MKFTILCLLGLVSVEGIKLRDPTSGRPPRGDRPPSGDRPSGDRPSGKKPPRGDGPTAEELFKVCDVDKDD